MLKKIFLVLVLVCLTFTGTYAQETEEIVFLGSPVLKISEGGTNRVIENLEGEKAIEAECKITKIGDKYFWKTRNDVELFLVRSGAFATFVATSGAGYVRVILPDVKEAASLMSETEKQYDYVEHMLTGLKSVTYYGNSQ